MAPTAAQYSGRSLLAPAAAFATTHSMCSPIHAVNLAGGGEPIVKNCGYMF